MKASRILIAGTAAVLYGVAFAQSPQPEQNGQPTQPTHPAMPQTQDPSPQQTPPPEQGGQPTQPTHPAVQGEPRGASFESLDKDTDGRISKAEAEADVTISEQFAMFDTNNNGFIERDEASNSNKPSETPKE